MTVVNIFTYFYSFSQNHTCEPEKHAYSLAYALTHVNAQHQIRAKFTSLKVSFFYSILLMIVSKFAALYVRK